MLGDWGKLFAAADYVEQSWRIENVRFVAWMESAEQISRE
jgi:hypothetical protein